MLSKIAGRPVTPFEKVIIILLIIIFLALFYLALDANKYSAQVHVIEGVGKVGVNPTSESLDFGDLSPGTTAVRRVSLENSTGFPIYVAVFRLGNINDLVKMDKNFFTLKGNDKTKIEFTSYMPASAPIDKTYTGRVYIFKVPLLWMWSGSKISV